MKHSVIIKQLKLNKIYSSLKEPNLILSKQLSAIKEKNEQLKQRVKELETNNQCTLTKEEMKEMLKEGLTSITNVLIGTETEKVNVETQTDKDIAIQEEKKVQEIKGIEQVIESEELDTYGFVYSLTVTEDKRIASGGYDSNISISSYDINKKKWKREIHKENVHDGGVYSLGTLNGNKLLSCGGFDHSTKVWSLSDVELTLIKKIKGHTDMVCEVIPLSKERFASCSWDKKVRVWKDDDTYECISTLQHDHWVRSILQLRGKETLVSAYGEYKSSSPRGISFWNINNYTKQHTIKGYRVGWSTHMIELSNGNITLSSDDEPYSIVIIDSSTYQVKKEIQLKKYISYYSSLCVFDEHSFIYAYKGTFLQLSNENGSILFHSREEDFGGYRGIFPLEGGKYFAILNGKRISIIKPCFA